MHPNSRLEGLIKALNLNPRQFAVELGYQQATTIYNIIKRNSTPSKPTINKICDRFPQVNKDWLLTGHGTMFNTTTASSDDLTVTAKQVLDKLEPILKEDFQKLASQINEIHKKIHSIEYIRTLDYINTKKKKKNNI